MGNRNSSARKQSDEELYRNIGLQELISPAAGIQRAGLQAHWLTSTIYIILFKNNNDKAK